MVTQGKKVGKMDEKKAKYYLRVLVKARSLRRELEKDTYNTSFCLAINDIIYEYNKLLNKEHEEYGQKTD